MKATLFSPTAILASAVFALALLPSGDGCPAVASDWPTFLGKGDRVPPESGLRLVDDLDHAPVRWELGRHVTLGKGLYPQHVLAARERGIEPLYGGASSPIVAEGTIFYASFKSNGQVPTRRTGWRTMDSEERLALLPDWFFSVTADDILIAVDTQSGQIKWEAVEPGQAHNRLGHKRGHWGVAPAYAQGRVFSLGTAGRLYAYDARSGEKLWDTVAVPRLQQAFKAHLETEDPALHFDSNLKSSLMVAGDHVIVADGGLHAFDAATGEPRWHLSEAVNSRWATPAPWQHDANTCLLVNDGKGTARLIDSKNGAVLWTLEGLGNQLGSVNLADGIAILNAGSSGAKGSRDNGLFAAYRLSLEGAERLWTLPDEPKYRHPWRLDRGPERRAAIHRGRGYFIVGTNGDHLVTVDMETGRVLDEQTMRGMGAPYPIEDRLLVYHDRTHTDPVTASWWSLDDPGRPQRLHETKGFAPYTTTAYEVPIEWPVADGILYAVTMWTGLAAIDLRKPVDDPANQPLSATLPSELIGTGESVRATFIQRAGKLTHGSIDRAMRMHAIDTSRATWEGRRLNGTLGVDVQGRHRFEQVEIDAEAEADGSLTGTISVHVPGFREPREVAGRITLMPHQEWMPAADTVLQLEDAVFQAGGNRGRLLLFLRQENGSFEVGQITGMADQTTQTPPVLDTSELTYEDGRLTGILRARYRPDQWAAPLVEQGRTAAAEYRIDVRVSGEDAAAAGKYEGTYGVEWQTTMSLQP
ncbi:MAG: PQQ-binding-like beta-propeller repeat protein [Phycisphaeraceae bacterium]